MFAESNIITNFAVLKRKLNRLKRKKRWQRKVKMLVFK